MRELSTKMVFRAFRVLANLRLEIEDPFAVVLSRNKI
jgi:hypothetical protein